MSVGRIWNDEPFRYRDPHSGREVTQLTRYKGHSNHLYFTDPCWTGDRSFIFTSDREGRSNLFHYDLAEHRITQLTDLDLASRPGGCYSQANRAHYFGDAERLYELELRTLGLRELFRAPRDFVLGERFAPTADGAYVCGTLTERAAFAGEASVPYSYSRFVEFFEKRPLTRVVRIAVATGEAETLHEDRCYLGHVNPSPTQPHLLTFCHEGPWARVDHRIWGLDMVRGQLWKIRPQDDGVAVGHEYWHQDGRYLGYHGFPRTGPRRGFFGAIRPDNTGREEFDFPFHSWHFQSNGLDLVVGDGTQPSVPNAVPFIMLFKREGERFVGPRLLAMHRSTFNDQHAHPHPRFAPDGQHVLYTSDLTGYANLYWVAVGDFYDLPEVAVARGVTE
ncbi:oligogalacturonate lyase family protein [Truepera radiovictrix]|uniref:Oligogalacturonide lyase n=1 Tax=Truepera radiovictrix (strain DSM 17093 / CIP 108686 / LMG 22925 / RQ-24) TaxID=649638 RepID=D7CQH2_TRURR|nr:oligogalacturonate lyase family protein [Truepera radiovictrix]ADI14956.1 Oligogalacturonide lyase [Truepera radiovictrix DSM 17093]WMT56489.1 oligogalacturonate lyase family protein [Truepera radiovictrix]